MNKRFKKYLIMSGISIIVLIFWAFSIGTKFEGLFFIPGVVFITLPIVKNIDAIISDKMENVKTKRMDK